MSEPPRGGPWDLPVEEAPFVFLDLEMTGVDARADRICELAVRRRVGPDVASELVSLVRPGVPVAASEAVHGLDDVRLAAAPPLAELAPRLAAMLDGAVLVGHHVEKDLEFLRAAAARGDLEAPPEHALDTLVLSRRALHANSHSLAALSATLTLPAPTHRALPDVVATEALFHWLIAALRPRTPRDLWQVRAGERRASMRDDVRTALERAVATSGHARICYRVPRRPPAAFTMRIARLAPPHVEGLLLETGFVRVLRGDRILWAEPVPETR